MDAGGFGLAQRIATFCFMVIRNQNNQFNYGLTFLLMKQLYDCRYDPASDFTHCPSEEICAAR